MGAVHDRFAGHSETGLVALATLLALNKMVADPEQLRHEIGHEGPIEVEDVLRLAKRREGVRAKVIETSFDKLSRLPLPAMASGPQGWFVIGRASETEVLIQRPGHSTEKRTRETVAEIWSNPAPGRASRCPR